VSLLFLCPVNFVVARRWRYTGLQAGLMALDVVKEISYLNSKQVLSGYRKRQVFYCSKRHSLARYCNNGF